MTASPGWHPDPTDPSQMRWWDGSQWTAQVFYGTAPLQVSPAAMRETHQEQKRINSQKAAASMKTGCIAIGGAIVCGIIAIAVSNSMAAGITFALLAALGLLIALFSFSRFLVFYMQ